MTDSQLIKLTEYLELTRNEPFRWGRHDCVQWVLGALRYIFDITIEISEYSSEEDAALVLKAHGGLERMAERYADEIHCMEISPPFAQRGDVALVRTDDDCALGICLGDSVALPHRVRGLAHLPCDRIVRAWRMPSCQA